MGKQLVNDVKGGSCSLKYCSSICLEGLKKTMKNLRQDGWCTSQESNQARAKYKSDITN